MSEEIILVLDKISEKIGVAIDWTSENILSQVYNIIESIRLYNIVKYSMLIIFLIVLFFISIKIITKTFKDLKNENKNSIFINVRLNYENEEKIEVSDIGCLAVVLSVICIAVILVYLVHFIPNLLEWIFIPEISIVRYIQELM